MKKLLSLSLGFFLLVSCGNMQKKKETEQKTKPASPDFILAFGSCDKQDLPQPLWKPILQNHPDVFLWGGDNVYSDTDDPKKLKADYEQQKQNKDYQALLKSTVVLGTWDDHDYGKNDGGANWHFKDKSKELFLDFFDAPDDDPRRNHGGVYSSRLFETGKGSIKVILLDTRYFRSPLEKSKVKGRRYDPNPDGTILGEEQWQWLERELSSSKADFNVILSSVQVLSGEHGFECWANFPKDVKRLKEVLRTSEAQNVILLSGDRHISEFSKAEIEGLEYPLYDFTSSGLTHVYSAFHGEANKYRTGKVVAKLSFGLLKFDMDKHQVNMEMRGKENRLFQEINVQYP